MSQKKLVAALVVCVLLFALALAGSLLFSQNETGDFQGAAADHIVISEILASNRTYPNETGHYLDFIEVRNVSNMPTDLAGYMLSDDAASVGYTFPPDTVLQPGGYLVVWCDKEHDGDRYATFGISREGGDTIFLYNSANVVVDQKEVPRMNANVPLIRLDDGSWAVGEKATPGYPNTEEGYALWLHKMGGDTLHVVISEVMTSNSCTATDGSGRFYDWIELYNAGNTKAVLDGAWLSNDLADPAKWQIPTMTLKAGERVVIRCAGTEATGEEATFALEREGCTVVLTGVLGNTVDRAEVPLIERDHSWALQEDGSWSNTESATPGYPNTEAGYEALCEAFGTDQMHVVISEVMAKNRSTLLNASGAFGDWIELYNAGSEAAVLDGAWLSDDPADRAKWQISALTLQPGERTVIHCAGPEAPAGEANFALDGDGCSVLLTSAYGTVLSAVECPRLDDDRVWALQAEGTYAVSDQATPGYENSEDGRLTFMQSAAPAGPIVISEVMPSNDYYLRQSDAEYYDWVELYNASDAAVDLSQYALAEKSDEPWQLPQITLDPGERTVIICSGYPELTRTYTHAPFALNGEECWVYVIGPDGGYSDYLRVHDVPYRASAGRMDGANGVYYFAKPTPDAANGSGVAFVSTPPAAMTAEGVYNGIDTLMVALEGPGEIRYTLDGSEPTQKSALYEQPLELTKTTVLRAVSFEEGKYHSGIMTASYIINENHTLPVLSVTADGAQFNYMYRNAFSEIETPCNLTFFENGEGFNIDCGIKMHGHTGLEAPKKSFKVMFRGAYGSNYLTYPVYGEGAPEVYSSLLIRAGQDYPLAVIREELFTSLALDASDHLLAQRGKYCILYVNGQYRGIYCLREAFSETYYAENFGVPEESVTVEQAPVALSSDVYQVIRYPAKNDMSDPEHYAFMEEHMDLDSLIDWMIFEAYATNADIQQNLRYIKSTENGDKWQFAFYDLDWAWYSHNPFRHQFSTTSARERQFYGMCIGMMDNPDFRARFFTRCNELMETYLSNEYVLARIDEFQELLLPEMERERDRWDGSVSAWLGKVQSLRNFITEHDHLQDMVNNLRAYVGLTQEEAELYFPRWA